jgi:hypothetical protein
MTTDGAPPSRAAAGQRRAQSARNTHPPADTSATTPDAPNNVRRRTARGQHYHVYVVELDDAVWNIARFRRANPDYQLGKPLVYVGMTGLDPDLRFDKHKAGIQSNSYVRRFGLRLLPGLYTMYNPMPYEGARDMEVELGIALREAGYGVWQG